MEYARAANQMGMAKMALTIKPETRKELDEAGLLFSLYFIIFSIIWIASAIFWNGDKGLVSFMWWTVINSAIWTIGISATSMVIKMASNNYLGMTAREKRWYWQTVSHYLKVWVAGSIIAGLFVFVFDVQLSQRFADIEALATITSSPPYMILLGGITAIYIDHTNRTLGTLGYRGWRRGR